MPLPDNRLRFSSTKIDFVNDVGLSSQDHDNYPPPQGQARYDHLRMILIALLSQQSSYDAPTQYRDGTPWFDLNTLTLKVRKGDTWAPYSDVISLGDVDNTGNYKTLSNWYDEVTNITSILSQEVIFSGLCIADGINVITIPEQLRSYIFTDTRALVYVNGLLIDPRNCSLSSTTVNITNVLIDTNDEYTVILRRVPNTTFYTESVIIP